MVRSYETVLIVDSSLVDEKIESKVKEVESFLGEKGKLKETERLGTRRLAYKIKKKTHGNYSIFNFDCEGSVIKELEHRLLLDESVLRFLTVLKD